MISDHPVLEFQITYFDFLIFFLNETLINCGEKIILINAMLLAATCTMLMPNNIEH